MKKTLISFVIMMCFFSIFCIGSVSAANNTTEIISDETKSQIVTLKDNEYFVLGDNREDSLDSRYYGAFSKDKIKGTTDLVLFPFNKIGIVK